MADARSERVARARRPVSERGRWGRLWGGLIDYARTAWWGVFSARVSEERALVVVQAVVLRARSGGGRIERSQGGSDAAAGHEVLLSIRSDLFGWELPGGTLEPGESPAEALLREVKEETGLVVESVGHVGDWVRRGFRPHTAKIFLCRVVSGQEEPSTETPRLGWFDAAQPPKALFPWYRAPLAEALEQGATPPARPVQVEEWQGTRAILAAMVIDLRMRWGGLPEEVVQRGDEGT